jgi:hypothetical protein
VEAIVVDECDSNSGCKDNIVDASKAVWKALGLNSNIGVVPVTWSDTGPDAYCSLSQISVPLLTSKGRYILRRAVE